MFWASASPKGASFHYRETRGLIQILHRIFKRLLSFFPQESMFCLKVRTSCDTSLPHPLQQSPSPVATSRGIFILLSSLLFFFQHSPRFFGLCFSHFIKSLFVHSFNCICTVKLALVVAISLGTFLFPFTSFNWDPRPFLRWSSFICTPLESDFQSTLLWPFQTWTGFTAGQYKKWF